LLGITFVEGVVTGKKGKKRPPSNSSWTLGAIYSLLPEKDWKAIGLKPKRSMTFTPADGSKVKRDVPECHITLPQGDAHTPVVLGESGDDALLGAVTLEILGLVLDPFRREWRQMQGLLA
jgi:hypothetical protein